MVFAETPRAVFLCKLIPNGLKPWRFLNHNLNQSQEFTWGAKLGCVPPQPEQQQQQQPPSQPAPS